MSNKILKYVKNLSTYFGASLIPMLLSLISNPWIAKNMSPEDYAITGYYTSFSTLIGPIIVFYMIHFYVKEYFRLDEEGRKRLVATIAKALIWFSGLVSVFCFIALSVYLRFIKEGAEMPIFPYLMFTVFALPLTGLFNLRLSQFRMKKRATSFFRLSVCNGVLNVALSILFVVLIKWGAVGKLLSTFVANLAVFLYMLNSYKGIWKEKTEWSQYKSVISFCFPLALSAMLGYFTNGFTTTYLESVGKTTEYGIYVVGASIGAYLNTFSTAINSTFQPDIYETTIKKQWKRYARFCIMQIGLIAGVVIVFILLAPFVVSLLTAGRYDASTPFAQIIAVSTIASSMYYLVNNYSIATNRPRLYLYTTIIGSVFMILAVPYAVNHWEFYGGAWMATVSFIAFGIINLCLLMFVKSPSKKLRKE